MVRLSSVGYKVSDNAGVRRRSLERAVRRGSYRKVYHALSSRLQRASKQYKKERLRADRNWLRKKMKRAGVSL